MTHSSPEKRINDHLDRNEVIQAQRSVLMSVSNMSAKDIAAMPQMDGPLAKIFYDTQFAQSLSPSQNAVLALTQSKKIMEDHQVVNSINRHLKFDERIDIDNYLSMKIDEHFGDPIELLKMTQKVLREVKSPSLAQWPANPRALATMQPKALAELPLLSQKQSDQFIESNVEFLLSAKQISVLALSQDRVIFPESVVLKAVNKFLPEKQKLDSFYNLQTLAIRDDLIKHVVSTEPRQDTSMSSRFMSMFGATDACASAKKTKAVNPR